MRCAMIVSRAALTACRESTTSKGFDAHIEGIHSPQLTTPGGSVITLGVILLIIGLLAKIAILWTIGIVLVVVGLVLALLGMMGRAVGGRAHYY